jgi:ribosomal protein S18 acetylase RimI-like enzyme
VGQRLDQTQARVTIKLAGVEDLASLLDLQRLCYQREAELYGDYTIAPLTQTLDSLREDLATQVMLVARLEGELVGSVRGRLSNGTCHIGRVIVHPRHERQGLGGRLMCAIEKRFLEAERFELFTGHRSEGNIRFYERLGYRIFRSQPVTTQLTLVYMEKRREA